MSLKTLTPQTEFLTISQAAEQLHVSQQTLRDWTDQDRVDAYVTEGGHRRYKAEEVQLLAVRNQAEAQGRYPGMDLYKATLVISRAGDAYSMQDLNDKSVTDVVEISSGNSVKVVAECRPTLNKRWEEYVDAAKAKYPNIIRNLEQEYLYGGKACYHLSNLEVSSKWTDTAYVQQWVHVVAGSEEELQIKAAEAIEASLAVLKSLEPVVSVIAYKFEGKQIDNYID